MASTTKTWINNSPPSCEDDDLNGFKAENNNLITGSGQSLSTGDNEQTHKAVANYSSDGDFYTDSGIANAYVLSVLSGKEGITVLRDGQRLRFRTSNASSGATTVNANGLGVVSIVDSAGVALTTQISATSDNVIVYDLSNGRFILDGSTGIGKSFFSTGQTITSAGLITLSHFLGEEPKIITYTLQCTTAEHNYSIGDRIDIDLNNTTDSTDRFNSVRKTSTQIRFRFSSVGTSFIYADANTGVAASLTNARWELYIGAFA